MFFVSIWVILNLESYISDIELSLQGYVTAADGCPNNKLVCFKLDFLQTESSALSADLLAMSSVADFTYILYHKGYSFKKSLAAKKLRI